jgi:hypothetical protein
MSDTTNPTPEQVNKLAVQLLPYLRKAIAENPTATRDESVATAMKLWVNDSAKIAALAQDEQFCAWAFENFG